MDEAKRKRLEASGWVWGDYGDFLGLTDAERQHIELAGALSDAVKILREARGLTQRSLARRIGATPSLVAKIEKGIDDISLDLMFRAYFEVGGKLEDLARGQVTPPVAPEIPEAMPTSPAKAPSKPKPRKRMARSGG